MSFDYKNVPSHTLVSLILIDDGEHDRELMIIELVERYSISRCLLAEVLNVIVCDCPDQEIISNDMIIQMEDCIR